MTTTTARLAGAGATPLSWRPDRSAVAVALVLTPGCLLAPYVPLAWDWSHGAWAIETRATSWSDGHLGTGWSGAAVGARAAAGGRRWPPGLLAFAASLGCYLLGRLAGVFRLELLSLI